MKRHLGLVGLLSAAALGVVAGALPFRTDPSKSVVQTSLEQQVCASINTYRQAHGKPPYQVDARLQLAADNKAQDEAQWLYMAHDRPATPDGQPAEPWQQHFYDAGYPVAAFNENLAYSNVGPGGYTPDGVVQAWTGDAGHLANLLSDAIGVGCGVATSLPMNGQSFEFFVMDAGYAPVVTTTTTTTVPTTTTETTTTSTPTTTTEQTTETTTETTITTTTPPPTPVTLMVGQVWFNNTNGVQVLIVSVNRSYVTFKRGTQLVTKPVKVFRRNFHQ